MAILEHTCRGAIVGDCYFSTEGHSELEMYYSVEDRGE